MECSKPTRATTCTMGATRAPGVGLEAHGVDRLHVAWDGLACRACAGRCVCLPGHSWVAATSQATNHLTIIMPSSGKPGACPGRSGSPQRSAALAPRSCHIPAVMHHEQHPPASPLAGPGTHRTTPTHRSPAAPPAAATPLLPRPPSRPGHSPRLSKGGIPQQHQPPPSRTARRAVLPCAGRGVPHKQAANHRALGGAGDAQGRARHRQQARDVLRMRGWLCVACAWVA